MKNELMQTRWVGSLAYRQWKIHFWQASATETTFQVS